jgi:hypothetical protein
MFWLTERWLSIELALEGIHLWHCTKRLDHCVGDDVSK